MKYLIIGGSGFVGSSLIKKLNLDETINFDKRPSNLFNNITKICDIRNFSEISISKKTDFVVLLAAEHRDDITPKSLYYDVNVQGTKNVLKAMDESGVKNLIFTSSVAVYGLNKINPNENQDEDPFNHYGKSKSKAEKEIKKWYQNNPDEKSVTIIRPTVIFGEKNRGNVYNLMRQINSGKFIMIGNGNNKKSMAYVENIVHFIINRMEKRDLGYHIYNYSDRPDFTMNELSKTIQDVIKFNIIKIKIPYLIGIMAGYCFDLLSFLTRKKLPISSVRVKKFCATTQFNSDKAHKIFNPPYKISEALKRTIEYEFVKSKT